VEGVVAAAVLFGSIAQAVTGFGFSLVCAPFLVAAYGAPTGLAINLLASTFLNLTLLLADRRHVDRRAAVRLLVPAVVATVVLGLLVRDADMDGLTVVAGLLCLVGVVAVARRRTLRRLTGPTGTTVVGLLSGAMNVVSGIGGPPVVLFGTTAGWSPQVARPTLQAFFLGINVVALVTLGLPDRLPALVAAAMVVGLVVGRPVARRLHEGQVRVAVLVTAGAGSLLAVVRGLT
jgi:uncharacterized protein